MTDHGHPPTSKDLRKFGALMAVMIGLIFGLFFPWILGRPWPRWPWITGAVFLVPAAVFPAALGPVHRVWMWVGEKLGWINSRIILGFVFFIIFVPAGWIMRLFGKDPMARKLDRNAESYKIPRAEITPLGDMEKPF